MAGKKSNESKKGSYDNPLGNMTLEDLAKFKKTPFDELYKWLQGFMIKDNQCPPEKLCAFP